MSGASHTRVAFCSVATLNLKRALNRHDNTLTAESYWVGYSVSLNYPLYLYPFHYPLLSLLLAFEDF